MYVCVCVCMYVRACLDEWVDRAFITVCVYVHASVLTYPSHNIEACSPVSIVLRTRIPKQTNNQTTNKQTNKTKMGPKEPKRNLGCCVVGGLWKHLLHSGEFGQMEENPAPPGRDRSSRFSDNPSAGIHEPTFKRKSAIKQRCECVCVDQLYFKQCIIL